MRLSCLIAIVVMSGCATTPKFEDVRFRLEETNRLSFSHSGVLEVGATLEIHTKDLNPLDVFHLNKCATPCDKSRLMGTLDGEDGQDQTLRFLVEESGRYYMWVYQTLPTGEAGPVTIERFRSDGPEFNVVFESGTRVEGILRRPHLLASGETTGLPDPGDS